MKRTDYWLIAINLFLLFIIILVLKTNINEASISTTSVPFWNIQSIDTVKFSRDPAQEHANDPSFDKTIDSQMKSIADTGANYVAISTPYDKEFIPFLKRWVDSARKYNLHVWFRGNFAGWEGWFNYPPITRQTHEQMIKQFILDNGSLFTDGDIFSSCTECENGGPGDPRKTGDVAGHRQFLIDEYQISRQAFAIIGKSVATNYFPMNGDVARLVMDPATTQALGGIVVIDHYVPTPEDLNQSISDLAASSSGKIVLGEFGVPIPGLQGNLTEQEQANWIKKALILLSNNQNLIGINYWTGFGGSTALWNDDGTPKQAASVLKSFFVPRVLRGVVLNEAGQRIKGAEVASSLGSTISDAKGQFYLPFETTDIKANVMADGYFSVGLETPSTKDPIIVVLKSTNESSIFKVQKLLYKILKI